MAKSVTLHNDSAAQGASASTTVRNIPKEVIAMAEVAAAATIVQLISFTGSILVAGYGYLSTVREGPVVMRSLLSETSNLDVLLNQLKSLSDEGKIAGSALAILSTSGALKKCEDLMKDIQRRIEACQRIEGERVKNLAKKLVWPFQEKETKDMIEQLRRLREALSAAVAVDSARSLRNLEVVAARIDINVAETLETVTQVKADLDTNAEREENLAIRRWLYPDGIDSEQSLDTALELRNPATGSWLLDSVSFSRWKADHRGWMWLYGLPGCGKTVLSATVIDHLLRNKRAQNSMVIYFFCNHRDSRKQSLQDLLLTMVKQLVEEDSACIEDARRIYSQLFEEGVKNITGKPLTTDQYLSLIKRLCLRWTSVSLVVDALDECVALNSFLSGLCALVTLDSNVRILVTSRHEVDLEEAIGPLTTYRIPLVDEMEDDIETYLRGEVASRIARGSLRVREKGLLEIIVKTLKKRAGGMILTAKLHLDLISGLRNDRAIKAALDTVPTSLYPTYDEILSQLCEKRPGAIEDLKRILQWLTGTLVPLTLNELAEAISIQPEDRYLDRTGIDDPEDLAPLCGSLVTLRTYDTRDSKDEDLRGSRITIISLSHASVEEYLRSDKIGKGLAAEKGKELYETFHMEPSVVHYELAKTCLQYVGFEDFKDPIPIFDEKPSMEEAEDCHHSNSSSEPHSSYFEDDKCSVCHSGGSEVATSPAVICPHCNHSACNVFQYEIRSPSPSLDRRRLRGRTSLYALSDYASRYWADHLRLSEVEGPLNGEVERLLKWFLESHRHAELFISWKQMYHHSSYYYCPDRPPLHYAIEFQIGPIVSRLLPASEQVDELVCGVSALHVASRCGATQTVQELLRLGASIELKSSPAAKEMTALHYAAEGGNVAVIRLLLAHGASPHTRSQSYATPFYRAARSGSLKALKLLYHTGSDINALTWDRFTPLFEALAHSRLNVAAQLLAWGADPTIVVKGGDLSGECALQLIKYVRNGAYDSDLQGELSSKAAFQIVKDRQGDTQKPSSSHSGNQPDDPATQRAYIKDRRSKGWERHDFADWELRHMSKETGELNKDDWDIIEQIRCIRGSAKSIEGIARNFRTFLFGLQRTFIKLEAMEYDTRPGTERERDERLPDDPTLIVTSTGFEDKDESDEELMV